MGIDNKKKIEDIAFLLFLGFWIDDKLELEELGDGGIKELYVKWIDIWLPALEGKHSGDCTKEPWACTRCQTGDLMKQAEKIYKVKRNVEGERCFAYKK